MMWTEGSVAHSFESKERTDDVVIEEAVTFEELLLSESVLSGLKKSGFHKPSPIQLKAIPLGRCGLDLVVQAKSGTGKTCVFSVIALENTDPQFASLQVIILAPTREIALQIHDVISCIGRDIRGLNAQVFIGGTQVSDDRVKAKRCHIAIGSPGRLKQLIELGVLVVSNVRMFVLDEADKLVEEGSFQQQINWIYSSLPPTKQVVALSATYPEILAQFLTRYMRDPNYVRLNPNQPSLLGLRQFYVVIKQCSLPHLLFEEKTKLVIELLSSISFQQALIFSNYHSRAESICEALNSSGWPSTFISGNMEQSRRTEAIGRLKQFKCRVLISTDLTSRGIDANNVDVVINMDVPCDWETYMHRIGRAGRFGSRGVAISLVSACDEEAKLQSIAAQCNASISPLHDVRMLEKKYHIPSNTTSNHAPSDEDFHADLPGQVNTMIGMATSRSLPDCDITNKRKVLLDVKKTNSHENRLALLNNCENDDDAAPSQVSSSPLICEPTMVACQSECSSSLEDATRKDYQLPMIPSLRELEKSSARVYRHYLHMSYDQLKEDYEFFEKTGEFAPPPLTQRKNSIQDVTFEVRKLSVHGDGDSWDIKSGLTGEVMDKSPDVPPNEVKQISPPLHEIISKSVTSKHGNVSHNNLNGNINTNSIDSQQDKEKESVETKGEEATSNHVMECGRQNHPMSVIAGVRQLKHWITSENVTKQSASSNIILKTTDNTASKMLSSQQKLPSINKHSTMTSKFKSKQFENCDREKILSTNCQHGTGHERNKVDVQSAVVCYNLLDDNEASSDSSSSVETSDTSRDEASSSTSSESSSEGGHFPIHSPQPIHTHPPIFYPVTPTGHYLPAPCNPQAYYMYPDITSADEALFRHYIYQRAMLHARNQSR